VKPFLSNLAILFSERILYFFGGGSLRFRLFRWWRRRELWVIACIARNTLEVLVKILTSRSVSCLHCPSDANASIDG